MAAYAIIDDVEALWRPLSDDEADVATALLDQASRMIRARIVDIDTRIAGGKLDAAVAGDVAVAMVLRVLKHPDSVRSETDQFGDESHTRVFDQAVSAGLLYIDDTEVALLSKRGVRAFSVAPAQEPTTAGHVQKIAEHDAAWGRERRWRPPC